MKKLDISYLDVNSNLSYNKIISQKLTLLINTLPGEFRLDPEYGTSTRKHLFKSLDLEAIQLELTPELIDKTKTYVPEILLNKIIFSIPQNNTLRLELQYVIIKESISVTEIIEVQ